MGIGLTMGIHNGPQNKVLIGGGRNIIGAGNPNNLAVVTLQSNAGGAYQLASAMTDFPLVTSTFSNVKVMRRGAAPPGTPPASWITEGPEDMQPRVTQIDPVSFPALGGGIELQLARALDAIGPSGTWRILVLFMDGSGLENHWDTATMRPLWIQYVTDACNQMQAQLRLVIPIGGEADSGESPDFLNFQTHLENFFVTTMMPLFGNFKMCVPVLSWHSANNSTNVISSVTSFAAAHPSLVKWINTNDLGFRVDNVHYAADAGGVKGYCTLGQRCSDGYNLLNTGAWPPTTKPYVKSIGVIVTGTSAQGVSCSAPTRAAGDKLYFVHCSNGQNAVTAPTGYASVTNSPQHDAASGANARLSVFERIATNTSADDGTVADVAGDGAKLGFIVCVGNATNGTLVTAGATAAASATVTFPSVDTTGSNNCLILNILACTLTTNGAKATSWSNADLPDIEQAVDFFTTLSSSGVCVFSGTCATGKVVAQTSATLSAATGTQALITIAVKP